MPPVVKDDIIATEAAPDSTEQGIPLAQRFAILREQYPLPAPTGDSADKEFFDTLSGQ